MVKNGDCDGSEYAANGGDVSKDVVEVMVKMVLVGGAAVTSGERWR